MTKEAKDNITINIKYERPYFIFPDLNSEQGNPREYFKLANAALKKSGYFREANELDNLKYSPYKEQFNHIARFLDFSTSKVTLEDDDYIYIKIKKDSNDIEQPRIFSQKRIDEIRDLINEGHDFSLINCYGRNHLHYLTDLSAIEELVEANKKYQWFDLFDLDQFNSTLLHGNRSFPVFTFLLNKMYEESPKMALTFLYGTNVFEQNAFGEFLKQCDNKFSKENLDFQNKNTIGFDIALKITSKNLIEFGDAVKIIRLVDPTKGDELLDAFNVLSDKFKYINDDNLQKLISTIKLDSILSDKKNSCDSIKKNPKI